MTPSTVLAQISRNPFLRDQNSHIFSSLIAIIRCSEWLEQEGFHIDGIDEIKTGKPVIHIHACAKCMELKRRWGAYSIGFDSLAGARADNWVAELFGCRVKWKEAAR